MAQFLVDWIRQLGPPVSGDARSALVKAVYEQQWSADDFAMQVIDGMPSSSLAESLTPAELVAIRRAWCDDFQSYPDELQPWWQQAAMPMPVWRRSAYSNAWPPPVGDPAWGDPRDEDDDMKMPLSARSSPRSSPLAGSRRRVMNASPLFQQGYTPAKGDKQRRGVRGRGISTFACGAISPTPDFFVERGGAAAPSTSTLRVTPRRPLSAPPGRRSPSPHVVGRRAKQRYNPPLCAPRCSGSSPWWHSSAWSTPSPEVESAADRPMPPEWPLFARASDPLHRPLRPRQNWIPASTYGHRLSTSTARRKPARWRN